MGGDFAPKATVAGARMALADLDPAHSIQLVGQTAAIQQQLGALLAGELSAMAPHRSRCSIVEAPDVAQMTDTPSAVARRRPNSSIALGLRLQADGVSDALVSACS